MNAKITKGWAVIRKNGSVVMNNSRDGHFGVYPTKFEAEYASGDYIDRGFKVVKVSIVPFKKN